MADRKANPVRCFAIYDGANMMVVDERLELYWLRKIAKKDIEESGIANTGARIVAGRFIPDEPK